MRSTLKSVLLVLFFGLVVFGQVTPIASVPVRTDINVPGPWGGTLTHSFLAANWERGELYVSNATSITVVDVKTWTVKNIIPAASLPSGMCLSSTGAIATTRSLGSSVTITDPVSGSSRTLYPGTVATDICAFSPRGDKLYVAANLRESATAKKLSEIDAMTGQVIRTWVTDRLSIVGIQTAALPDGSYKVYMIAQDLPGMTGELKVLGVDGRIRSVDVGTMPRSINISPDGRYAYIAGAQEYRSWNTTVVDTATDQVVRNALLAGSSYSFPSDSGFAYAYWEHGGGGRFYGLNLFQGSTIFVSMQVQPEAIYGLTASRQADGTDIVALLYNGRVDVFRVVQPPTLYAAVNAASFNANTAGKLQPGSLYSAFGWAITPTEPIQAGWVQSPDGPALPRTLGGIRVIVHSSVSSLEYICPLLYVSQRQVNFEFPLGVPYGPATIRLEVDGTSSDPVGIEVVEFDPGMFVADWSNMTAAAIIGAGERYGQAITAGNPVRRGGYASLFLTGLGEVLPQPIESGLPAGVASTTSPIIVTLGGVLVPTTYSGLAPGFAGLYQVNVFVPADAPTGAQILRVTTLDGRTSNETMLFVQ